MSFNTSCFICKHGFYNGEIDRGKQESGYQKLIRDIALV